MSDQPELTTVTVTNAIRVSSGEQTPGVVHVPAAEASWIQANRHGILGDRWPRGYADGGPDARTIANMMPRTEVRQ